MGLVELYHPVTEDKAREFVDATAPSDATDEERNDRVTALVDSARVNQSWRESRDPAERLALNSVPFASHDTDADEGDGDASS